MKTVFLILFALVCTVSTVYASPGAQQEMSIRNDRGLPIALQGSDSFELSWHVPMPKEEMDALYHPFLHDDQGNLYVWTLHEILSVDPNGNVRWRHRFDSHGGKGWALMMGKDGTIFGVQSPEIVNGAMTEKAGYIVALKRDTGQLLWDHVMEQRFPTNSVTPYFGAGDDEGNLILETGGGIVSIGPDGVNWSFQNVYPTGIKVMQAGLTLDASGNVYALVKPAVSISGPSLSLLCLDRTGNLLWRQDNAVQGGAIWMNLQILPDGKLYGVNFYDIYIWSEQQKQLVQVKQPTTELLDALRVPNDGQGALYRGNEKTDKQLNRIWTYAKEDGYYYVSIYTQSDDQGNVYFSDSGGNLFSLTPDGSERFVWKANNSNMSELPFYVSRDGTVYGYSVGVGIFRIGEKGNPIKLYVNGTRLTVPVNPEIKNGNTMVPLRKIFEALGADVAWNAEQRSVTVTKNNISLYLEIGSTVASVNGTATELEAATEILNNTTMVPVRFVSETLGAVVQWEAANRVVRIHT